MSAPSVFAGVPRGFSTLDDKISVLRRWMSRNSEIGRKATPRIRI
jgi:hypothetical protein